MILDLTHSEIAILDQWRNEIDRENESFPTWDSFIDFVHECQEGLHDKSDDRWVEREVKRIINIKFKLSSAYLDPHRIIPDNYPREYNGRYIDSFRSGLRTIEKLLRDEIYASGYSHLLIRDLDLQQD